MSEWGREVPDPVSVPVQNVDGAAIRGFLNCPSSIESQFLPNHPGAVRLDSTRSLVQCEDLLDPVRALFDRPANAFFLGFQRRPPRSRRLFPSSSEG